MIGKGERRRATNDECVDDNDGAKIVDGRSGSGSGNSRIDEVEYYYKTYLRGS